MAEIESFLQKKIGPLPTWAWAAAGGGLLSVIYLSKKGAAATSSTPTTPDMSGQNTGLFTPAPIIVTPGNIPSSTSSVNPAPSFSGKSAPPIPVWQFGPPPTNKASFVWHITPGLNVPNYPSGQVFPGTNTAFPNIQFSWQWALVPDGVDSTGSPWTADSYAAALMGGGMGGGHHASVMHLIPGSGGGKVLRKTSPHVHPQFLSLAGMGGGGHSHIAAISKQTKIPPLRIMAMNPRMVRPGRRPTALHLR